MTPFSLSILASALASPEVSALPSAEGPVSDRIIVDDGASLVLLYGGEQEGRVGPCGCEITPRGGLGRAWTVARALRGGPTPVLLLDAGAWLSSAHDQGALSADALAANARVHRALRAAPWDALNVGFRDLPGLEGGARQGLVSANLRPPDAWPVVRYRRFELDGLSVVVTGVSRAGPPFLRPEDTVVLDPEESLRVVLAEVSDADVVVVLVYDLADRVEALGALPGVDVVVDAAAWNARYGPWTTGDAVWVRSWDQGRWLGELRLWVEDGRVVRATDRAHALGPEIEVPDPIRKLEREERR